MLVTFESVVEPLSQRKKTFELPADRPLKVIVAKVVEPL